MDRKFPLPDMGGENETREKQNGALKKVRRFPESLETADLLKFPAKNRRLLIQEAQEKPEEDGPQVEGVEIAPLFPPALEKAERTLRI
jgi:hypothetical protein